MNFEKDLRKYTDDKLYARVDQHDPRSGALYSDELTRRSTDRWSQKMLDLTILLFFIGFLQLFVSLKSVTNLWVEWLFGMILVTYVIFYVVRLMKNKKLKNKSMILKIDGAMMWQFAKTMWQIFTTLRFIWAIPLGIVIFKILFERLLKSPRNEK